ncbi:ribosome-binding protein [Penicillium verrucosum]|nr:ribosome-binding protein [Penicillium verrucosum]KAJ5922021.1 ribosome-binding protein [Penicillium verrucosum]
MSMELDTPVPMVGLQDQQNSAATILCCNCGAAIDGTTSAGAMCHDCLRLNVDVSQGPPPAGWSQPPESKELLAVCLRRLRGLAKVRIIDASFIWTEPHSKRIKVKITIQQEVFQGTIIQQAFEVEYVVASQQCPAVQVRQKVPHKRTFLYLEQLILKSGAHKDTVNIKEAKDGLDFYFSARNHAEKMVDFLSSVAPCKSQKSEELISMDIHTSSRKFKFTFSVELIPICKDDLVALPIKLARQLGNISPLTLCYRVGNSVNVLDPTTLQTADIPTAIYWRSPFRNLSDVTELKEFIVLDIEPTGQSKGKFHLAEATVARSSDLGSNDITYFTRTHLGGILHVGDAVLGYHLSGTRFNDDNFEAIEASNQYGSTIPDVVLVKKSYARKRKPKNRAWRLKRMAREYEEEAALVGPTQQTRRQEQEANRLEEDYEMFLRDVEEDQELRQTLDLYKVQRQADAMVEDDDNESENEVPQVNMEELLDTFDEMNMGDE